MEKFSKWLTPVIALFFSVAIGATAATTVGTDIVTEGEITTPVLNVADGMTVTMTITNDEGVPTIAVSGGKDLSLNNTGDGDITINPSGGGEVTLDGRVRFVPQGSDPVACGGGTEGTIGYSATTDQLCFCNGVEYVEVASTTVACNFGDV